MSIRKLFVIILIFSSTLGFSQGQILSITTDPLNPTTADSVTVYVDLMFNYGGCSADNQAHSTNGNLTTASAHHCVGMLAYICSVTDTFELGYLQAGNHQFNFTLSSGSGGPGCSPGIVPDDSDILNFTVTSALGVEIISKTNLFSVYPNPTEENISIELDKSLNGKQIEILISDISGKIISSIITDGKTTIHFTTSELSKGVYLITLKNGNEILSVEKLMKK